GGMVAFALQCVFVAVVLLVRSRSTVPALTVTCALLLTVGLGLWLSSDQVIGRLTSIGQEADSVSRLQVSKDSLQMVKLHPVLGWGLGTFPTVYPQYRSFATDLFMNEAHNDVVQLLVETGVTGLSLALMLMLIVFREGIRQLNRAAFETWHTTGVVAALTACVGLSLHSLFDFNLHIPANAMLFYVLCALAASNGREETPVVRRLRRSGETAIVEV
ncbi:MAG TPA: O-antigen ligase family protein, partial [Clostridia bacterium]|nr:O-antigen ligase family protein [Clostridia bacterium]